jgi:ParB-like chromosome segregation protein Spo0J
MEIIEVKISDIKIGDRFRKDMGDLPALAKSVEETLLHPIGITPDHELVFGERRLRVYRDVLGRETIPARIIPVKSVLLGQIAENTMRKSFTPSELVAIVQALRTFTHGGDRRSDQARKCEDETLTTDEAARMVGLSKDTFARAQKVVDQGVPELVEAMDWDKVSVSAASELAQAEPEEQRAFLARVPNEGRWTAFGVKRHLRRQKNAQKREADAQRAVSMPKDGDAIRMYHCPFQQLEQMAGLAPASVQLVCTDIPYGQEFLPQLEELAALAKRVLVPGGLFVSYVGQFRLDEKLSALGKHLSYRWLCSSVWVEQATFVPHLKMVSKSIPMVIYSNGDWQPNRKWCDTFHVEGREKDWHEWQRPLAEVEKLVEYFSSPGDLVVDPCGGGFTTAIACHRLGRRFVGCDIDKAAVASGQERLAKERPSAAPDTVRIDLLVEDRQEKPLKELQTWIEAMKIGEHPKQYVRWLWVNVTGLPGEQMDRYLQMLSEPYRSMWHSLPTARKSA